MFTPSQLDAQGKQAFADKKYQDAATYFEQAADLYYAENNPLQAAEMMNNVSVALLQAGEAQDALEAAAGTDVTFADAKDIKRQAMAIGNQAAALEALSRNDEAIQKYEQSAELFAQINEGDLRAMVMKSAAAIKLKTGKVTDSAFKMMGSLDAKDNPTFFERILKFFMRFTK